MSQSVWRCNGVIQVLHMLVEHVICGVLRLFQAGYLALKSPAAMNHSLFWVRMSRSGASRGLFEVLHAAQMQILLGFSEISMYVKVKDMAR